MSEDSGDKWWFGFRHTHPKPPGRAIAYGPYDSYDEAMREREMQSRKWDCQVSLPFTAKSQDEANKRAGDSTH